MTESLFVTCSHCGAKNKLPTTRLNDQPKCGKCKQAVISPSPIELTDANFARFVQNNDMPIVVDFWASWCGPCQMMAPTFEGLSAELFTKIRFAKVNTEVAQQVAALNNIRSIPTLIVYKDGKEVTRQAGAMDKTSLNNWLLSVI